MTTNVFDQFDVKKPTASIASPPSGNVFDQFDGDRPSAIKSFDDARSVQRPQAPGGRGVVRSIADLGVGLGQGAVSATMAIPQIANTLTGGAVDNYVWKPVTGAVDRLAGGPGIGSTLAESSKATREVMDEWKSPQLREQEQDLANTKGFFASAGKMLSSPTLLAQQAAEQIPQFLTPAAAARKVGTKVGERVLASALEQGTAKRVAKGVAEDVAATAARPAAERLAKQAAGAAGARAVMATGGAIGAAQASEQAQQEVMGMDQPVLDANPDYQALVQQGMDPQAAREKMAMGAGVKAAAIAAPLDTLASGLTARLESNIFRGETGLNGLKDVFSARGAKDIAKAAGKEGAEETLQEGGEQFAQNVGVQGVDPNKDLMDQVPEQAAMGGTIGMVLGGAGVAGSGAISSRLQGPLERVAGKAPRFADAQPGSIQDAGNAIPESNAGAVGDAQGNTADAPPGMQEGAPADRTAATASTITPAEVTARAQKALGDLNAKANGTPEQTVVGGDGQPQTIAGTPAASLTDSEKELHAFLTENVGNPAALAQRLKLRLDESASEPVGSSSEAAPAPPNVPWFDQATGEMRPPTDNEIKDQFHQMIETASTAGSGMRHTAASEMLSSEWAVPKARLVKLRKAAMEERKAGITPENRDAKLAEANAAQEREDDDALAALDYNLGQPTAATSDQAPDASTPPTASTAPEDQTVAAPASTSPDSAIPTAAVPAATVGEAATPAPAAMAEGTRTPEVSAEMPTAPSEPSAQSAQAAIEPAPAADTIRADQIKKLEDKAASGTMTKDERAELGALRRAAPPAVNAETVPAVKPAQLSVGERRARILNADRIDPADVHALYGDKLLGRKAAMEVLSALKGRPVDAADMADVPSTRARGRQAYDPIEIARAARLKPEAAAPVDAAIANEAAAPSPVESAALESAAHPGNELAEPTPAQHAANNYKQGHINLHGLDVTIQVPKGGMRRGTDAKGKAWERAASDHYGHIRGTDGGDGEPHDVYLGPHAEDPNAKVFVIRQVKPGTKRFDESKAMIGYANGADARRAYEANFPKGMKVFGGIEQMSIDAFKERLNERQPAVAPVRGVGEAAPVSADGEGARASSHALNDESARDLTTADLTPAERAAFARQTAQIASRASARADEAEMADHLREESRRLGDVDAQKRGLRKAVSQTLGRLYGNTKVVFTRDADGVDASLKLRPLGPGRLRFGTYDAKSKTVYLFTDALITPAQAAFTAAHEVAGHKAMRLLAEAHPDVKVGKMTAPQALNDALTRALQNPTVAAIADSMGRQRRTTDRMLMAEEALADIAGAMRSGQWEKIEAKHGVKISADMREGAQGAIARFVELLRRIYNAIGSKINGTPLRLTNDHVHAYLDAAWANLKQGDTATTPATTGPALDAAGDAKPLDQPDVPIVRLTGDEIPGVSPADLRKNANEFIRRWLADLARETGGATIHNERTGFDIGVTAKGIRHGFTAHGKQQMQVVAAMREMLERAARVDSRPHEPLTGHMRAVHTLVAPVEIAGERFAVKLTVKEATDGSMKLYDHRALKMETPGGTSRDASPGEKLDLGPTPGASASMRAMLAAFKGENEKYLSGALNDETPQTESPAFKKWFGNSKVVDAAGKPLVVYHGTAKDFDAFDNSKTGANDMGLWGRGHYFASATTSANSYALREGDGARVIPAYVSIQNPLVLRTGSDLVTRLPDGTNTRELIGQNLDGAKIKAKAIAGGHDGVIQIKPDGSVGDVVAFRPEQIKSAIGNRGTFDPHDASILNDEGPAEGSFQKPQANIASLNEAIADPPTGGIFARAKDWLRGKAEDFVPASLAALQRRQLTELVDGTVPLKGYGKQYDERVQQLDADRQQLLAGMHDAAEHPKNMLKRGAANIAEATRRFAYVKGPAGWFGRRNPEAKRLADVMHDATNLGLDPSQGYTRLMMEDSKGELVQWNLQTVKERIRAIRGQMRGRGADDKRGMMEDVKALQALPKREKAREAAWPKLLAAYQALSPEAKTLYEQHRDWYSQMRDETEKALIARIEAAGRDMAGTVGDDLRKRYVRQAVQRIRLQFESNRLEGVYFPLNRDGDYWMSVSAKGEQGFKMFETAAAAAAAEKALRAKGYTIEAQGRRDGNYKAKNAPSGTFVAEIIQLLQKSGAPEKVQDEVYQTFLKTLPEMSMRKHSIHRKKVPGYSDDILRAFAKNSFHGAHQLARLRHAHELNSIIDSAQISLDNYRRGRDIGESSESSALDVARSDALLGELKRRNDYIMSPTDSQLANKMNAIGFIYYLGASPASALVNMTQNAQVTLPVLGAQHGWGKASRVLGAALRDSMRTFGNIERTLKDPEERAAYNTLRERGDIDKTNSHTLAGLAEGNLLQTNPVWAKTMAGMGYMFHKAEIINREAAGMAAYRLARSKGESVNDAVQYASDIINGTHFDYSAANRPRIMQNNGLRVALQFKNYSIGMTWMLYRNLYQSFKAESPEVRSQARKTLGGILGVTALMAGTMGLPIINAVKLVAQAAHAAFGDDEQWDFDTEFRQWLADVLGDDAAKWVADGAVNRTGINLSRRVGLSNLWFQDADRELEGKDAYYNAVDGILGPIGGMTKNFFIGSKMVGEGNVQRGIETMMPKFAKDAMKATRYAVDGSNTLLGAPIVADMTTPESLVQALGFQPTRLYEQQKVNSSLKNYEQGVLDRRSTLMNAYALSLRNGGDRDAVMEKIRAFNATYPELPIRASTLRQSTKARARAVANSENGVRINKHLAERVKEMAGVSSQ